MARLDWRARVSDTNEKFWIKRFNLHDQVKQVKCWVVVRCVLSGLAISRYEGQVWRSTLRPDPPLSISSLLSIDLALEVTYEDKSVMVCFVVGGHSPLY